MRCKLAWVLLVVLVVFSGCNVEEKEQDLTKVELRPDDVVMGAICRYQYSNEIYGMTDVILVYGDGRICIGTCPKEIGKIYSEFLGKVYDSDITVWSVLEDVEEVACFSEEEMEVLVQHTQSVDLEREDTNDRSGEIWPIPEMEDTFNWYRYFCYQWDEEHTPTYFPIKRFGGLAKWSNRETTDENALAALDLLLQNESYQKWYGDCQKIERDATQLRDE